MTTQQRTQQRSGTQSATPAQKTDWKSKPKYLLRVIHAYRKRNGLPIEPELNDELAKRFPGYDAEQKKFIGRGGRKLKPAQEVDWGAKSDNTLRTMFAYRKRNGLPIEPELNAVLAKRFPGYDAEQKEFTGRNRRKPTPSQKIDWNTKTNNTLRTMHAYRRKHGLPIEPELNAVLAKRFPGYDAKQKTFTGYEINWRAKPKDTLRAMLTYRKKHNMPIEPELNDELTKRFPTYDAEQHMFLGRIKSRTYETACIDRESKLSQTINWSGKSDNALREAQKQRAKTEAGIDDALNAELARRFPHEYDPANRTFINKIKTYDFTTRNTLDSPFATFQPAITSNLGKPELNVTLKPVRQVLNLTYNNVYVNGKLILRNHANTELKLFGDGTLLGAYGIIKNNPDLPQYPIWIIYDTNLVPNKWLRNNKWNGYNNYVANVSPTPNGLNLTLSDRRIILLENERLKRLAGIKRFQIQR